MYIMCCFSWIYNNRVNVPRNVNDRNVTNAKQSFEAKKLRDAITNYINYYIVYIANIFTNHGKY